MRQAIRRQTPSAAASGPVAGDVADHGVDGAVGDLHRVVEVAAEQRAPAARAVVRGQLAAAGSVTSGAGSRPRSRRAFSSACSARDLELLARLVRAPALDRVAHGARQALPVDLALDQVVLRARGDGLDAAPLVVEAR